MPPPTLWVPRNPSEQLTRRVDIREQDRRACRAVATGLDPDRRCAAASSLLRAGLLSKGARRTMFVVVIEELAEDRFELTAMEHQHPVEALPADAFARGDRIGVAMFRMPSGANTSSKLAVNLASRSRIKNFAWRPCSARSKLRLRACWVTHSPTGLTWRTGQRSNRGHGRLADRCGVQVGSKPAA